MPQIAPGSTDQTFYFKLVDPSTGDEETGLTIANLDATYIRDRAAAVKADLTALGAVDGAHEDNKAIEVSAANAPGLYRVDWPDAAFAAGVARVQLVVAGAAIDTAVLEVELCLWLTPITAATVRAVNGSDGALATSTALATAQADLDNPAQYKADVSGLATSAALAAVSGLVDDLESRLTAARAAKLDYLDAAISSRTTLGAGTSALEITVTDGASVLDGAEVDVTTTTAHVNPVATGYTDAFGKVTFHLDPGTYYIWVQHAGYNGTNPTAKVVT